MLEAVSHDTLSHPSTLCDLKTGPRMVSAGDTTTVFLNTSLARDRYSIVDAPQFKRTAIRLDCVRSTPIRG
jgi:hypothetical protein